VGLRTALGEFLYGMTGYEFARQASHMRHELGMAMMLLSFGDMVGLPILPPMYALRLLPHVMLDIEPWKRQLLRERFALDNEEFDLIEM